MEIDIPTYARNDNTDSAYRVEPINFVTTEKRLNVFLESNREQLFPNKWLRDGCLPVNLNASDALTKIITSANLLALPAQNKFKVFAEKMSEIRRKLPWDKPYIVYPETIHGRNGFDASARRWARAWRGEFLKILAIFLINFITINNKIRNLKRAKISRGSIVVRFGVWIVLRVDLNWSEVFYVTQYFNKRF